MYVVLMVSCFLAHCECNFHAYLHTYLVGWLAGSGALSCVEGLSLVFSLQNNASLLIKKKRVE